MRSISSIKTQVSWSSMILLALLVYMILVDGVNPWIGLAAIVTHLSLSRGTDLLLKQIPPEPSEATLT